LLPGAQVSLAEEIHQKSEEEGEVRNETVQKSDNATHRDAPLRQASAGKGKKSWVSILSHATDISETNRSGLGAHRPIST
jgi:hypothetical protein